MTQTMHQTQNLHFTLLLPTQEKFDLLAKYWPNVWHKQAVGFGHQLMLLLLGYYKSDFNLANISGLWLELVHLKPLYLADCKQRCALAQCKSAMPRAGTT